VVDMLSGHIMEIAKVTPGILILNRVMYILIIVLDIVR